MEPHSSKVANEFNDYFINISQNLLKNLGKTYNQFQDHLKNPSDRSLFLKEVEPGEVLKIPKSLNTAKSTDIIGIPPKMMKIAAEVLKTYIATFFNYSKIAPIHPLHKEKFKLICSKYCLMSILLILSKIYEELISYT